MEQKETKGVPLPLGSSMTRVLREMKYIREEEAVMNQRSLRVHIHAHMQTHTHARARFAMICLRTKSDDDAQGRRREIECSETRRTDINDKYNNVCRRVILYHYIGTRVKFVVTI